MVLTKLCSSFGMPLVSSSSVAAPGIYRSKTSTVEALVYLVTDVSYSYGSISSHAGIGLSWCTKSNRGWVSIVL